MTKVLEEITQDFEGLDAYTLTLGGQELADDPVTHQTRRRIDCMLMKGL